MGIYSKDHLCCYCSEPAQEYVVHSVEGKEKIIPVCEKHIEILYEEKDADLDGITTRRRNT